MPVDFVGVWCLDLFLDEEIQSIHLDHVKLAVFYEQRVYIDKYTMQSERTNYIIAI